jgi:2-dehydropantoate 2-reductase
MDSRMSNDPIYIIGSGAVGKSLAVFLTTAGRKATIIRGSVESGPATVENIKVVMSDGSKLESKVGITTFGNVHTLNGIVVVAIKSYGNGKLATVLKPKIGSSPVVVLQNGLGVENPFIEGGFPDVYRVVQFVTCQTIGNNQVRVKPVTACPVGVVKCNVQQLAEIVTTLNTNQFMFRTEQNIEQFVWRKAIINCAFNSICPLLEVDNGIFHRDRGVLAIASEVIEECVVVARTRGIIFDVNDLVENLLLISRSSDGQLISTLVDLQNGQPTEIDTLNLEVARLARQAGIADQVKVTKMLGEMVDLKSRIRI